jgi:DNA-binding NtrC family response regulator
MREHQSAGKRRMEVKILVINGDREELHMICEGLHQNHFQTIPISSLEELDQIIEFQACQAAVLDLDTMPVDNQLIKQINRRNPTIRIIGLSTRPYHPELKEAISKHMYACIHKPIDFDELLLWVKSVYEGFTERKEKEV